MQEKYITSQLKILNDKFMKKMITGIHFLPVCKKWNSIQQSFTVNI